MTNFESLESLANSQKNSENIKNSYLCYIFSKKWNQFSHGVELSKGLNWPNSKFSSIHSHCWKVLETIESWKLYILYLRKNKKPYGFVVPSEGLNWKKSPYLKGCEIRQEYELKVTHFIFPKERKQLSNGCVNLSEGLNWPKSIIWNLCKKSLKNSGSINNRKLFIPQGRCERKSSWGPNVLAYILIPKGTRERLSMVSTWLSFQFICHWWTKIGVSKTPRLIGLFRMPKTFTVWMGRWVDWWWLGGDKKGPSIFLKFEYCNKQDVLILNMALKVVCGN